ncbi:hypothetical protein DFH11DRAFT_1229987 [Phellopilus nigrolimitatus]|nr:hypothetical protein DFH11DRAFT_1229987 [Phellopilus nigrolimitatus]
MSSFIDAASIKKRKSEDDAQVPVDHRKRRRNRTTQSCLNCHGSKRMCDRKRPACGRCVKLGLSGICVYEVDDVSQRDSAKDETTHLKGRIAELEGFIREYKKKPHPRWAADLKKEPRFPALSRPRSDTSSDSDSLCDIKDGQSFDPNDTMSSATSPSGSESIPSTPSAHSDGPVFLTSQDSVSSLLFSGSDGMPSLSAGPSITFDSTTGSAAADDIDAIFSFNGVGLSNDDNESFERVFSQIMQQDAHRHAGAMSECQCMKKSSAYSVLLELAPHVRRALDALVALPEHHETRLNGPCDYLKHLQGLDSSISNLVDSVSTTLSYSPSSYTQQNMKVTSPTTLTGDSPLQRVWAAREAAYAQTTTTLASDTTDSIQKQKQARATGASHLWGARDRASSMSVVEHTSDIDQFMTWDAPSRIDWPRTISL